MIIEGPPYLTKQPFLKLEMDELFEGFQVHGKFIEVAKCVIRSNLRRNSKLDNYPEFHPKAMGTRYFLETGYADYIFQSEGHGIPARVIADSLSTKNLILSLVREFELP